MKKIKAVALHATPVLLMISLIPIVRNDYVLAAIYAIVILSSFAVTHDKNDLRIFVIGFFAMTASEYLFVSTGVETFTRNSLFGLMPLWLPLLWGYGFVVIKRGIAAINE